MALETSTATTITRGGESAVFECNICFDIAQDPVITPCGHLHCWPCIYKWLNLHSHSNECPVCKTLIQEQMLVPLYGRGMSSRIIPLQNAEIPRRPAGPRPETAPPPPRGSRRALRNFERSFSGVLSPVLGVQFREFYGGSLGFNYGSIIDEGEYGNDNKKMMKILVFILVFVVFDFIAM